MYLFMGNMRATLIPTIAVPVVLLGTFATLGLFGFSINMLTMFAMELAIGLLVDDAIVVVENVERIMSEEGLSPREATAKSMDQITSALIGIGLVLSAVFGPMAFFSGSTGVIYRQFSVTIIAAMMLSVLVALILTPVLCVSLLKPVEKGHEAAETGIKLLRPFFIWFDRIFFVLRDVYLTVVGKVLAKRLRYLLAFVVIVVAMGYLFKKMPTAYLPDGTRASCSCSCNCPPARHSNRPTRSCVRFNTILKPTKKTRSNPACRSRAATSRAPGKTPGWPSLSSRTGICARARIKKSCRRGPGDGGVHAVPQREYFRLRPAFGHRTGHGQRF
jgi:multidrug efflux pump subunit AcrB